MSDVLMLMLMLMISNQKSAISNQHRVAGGVFALASNAEQERLRQNIAYLTSTDLAGRDAPGPDADRTALWIAELFKETELTAAFGDTSYFQVVPLQTGALDTIDTRLFLHLPDGTTRCFKFGKDFYVFPRRLRETTLVGQSLSDCGFGIVVPERHIDDFAPDVSGKMAVVSAGSDFPPEEVGMRAMPAFKAVAAERKGAAALLILDGDRFDEGDSGGYHRAIWPPSHLADKIGSLSRRLVDLPEAEREFTTFFVNSNSWEVWDKSYAAVTADLEVRFRNRRSATAFNVASRVPGTTGDWVIIGAHYDHLGSGFPGADDNASGLAGLLALARRWAGRQPSARGVLFVAFTAEEDGLLGSQWFAKNLPVPREKVTAMVNLDMIGRDGFASMRDAAKGDAKLPPEGFAAAYFSGASPALRDILRAAADGVELSVTIQPVSSFRHFGDAASFHSAGIPTVHLFSGFHSDYHAPSDTPDKIDYDKLARMIDITDRVLQNLTRLEGSIPFDPTIKVEGGGMPY